MGGDLRGLLILHFPVSLNRHTFYTIRICLLLLLEMITMDNICVKKLHNLVTTSKGFPALQVSIMDFAGLETKSSPYITQLQAGTLGRIRILLHREYAVFFKLNELVLFLFLSTTF